MSKSIATSFSVKGAFGTIVCSIDMYARSTMMMSSLVGGINKLMVSIQVRSHRLWVDLEGDRSSQARPR